MSVEKNVPEIRFKGFSGDWEAREFGSDLVSVQTGTNLLAVTGNSGFPLIKMGNIQRGYFSFEKVERLSSSVEVEKENIANYGDFLFNTRNTLELVGKGATWMGNSNEFAFNNNIARFTLKEIDTIFFNYLYNTQQMIKQVQARAMGTTSVAAIYPQNLKSIRYALPKIKEQTQIGSYFQKLDSLINQHQQKHDKLSNIKKAMLEKMFPKQGETIPEIRFKGFSGKWEEIELSDEVTFINGRAYSQEELLEKGKYTVLRVGNFYTNSSWYYSDLELGDKYYANNGDLLYTWSASFGPHIWNGDKVIYHYHIWKLELSESIDKLFLLHLLDYDRVKILSGSNGSTMIHITKSAMEAKKVFIPKKDEQIVIGNYFQKLDALINQHQQQINKLNNIKQAFLSKMFV
ncbi:restriction endonuclease subunit S [Shewanella baltica]|uniref:restriction endonuclease subunit S n=1 Tax=Shewanella baltica TaxID=62322 RepID=UPI003D78ED6A